MRVDTDHTIYAIRITGRMEIFGAGGIVLSGKQQSCAEIEPVQEFVIQGDADAAAGPVACQ